MITLQQLNYFRALVKNGHLTRTAEAMHITQTTLSNTIINLERQLGLPLFDRVGRTLQLNEAGKAYYTYVNEALTLLENGRIALSDHVKDGVQSVSVAMTTSNIWSGLISSFRSHYPDYNIRQLGCDSEQSRNMLMDQELDFVIAGITDFSLSGLKYQIIREDTLFLCVPPDHPLAGRESVCLADVKDERFIDLPAGSSFRVYCDALFRKAGLPHRSALECDYTLRGQLVESGFGVAITTASAMQHGILSDKNVYIPIADELARRTIAIIWNPRRYLSRAALDFKNWVFIYENGGELEPPAPTT